MFIVTRVKKNIFLINKDKTSNTIKLIKEQTCGKLIKPKKFKIKKVRKNIKNSNNINNVQFEPIITEQSKTAFKMGIWEREELISLYTCYVINKKFNIKMISLCNFIEGRSHVQISNKIKNIKKKLTNFLAYFLDNIDSIKFLEANLLMSPITDEKFKHFRDLILNLIKNYLDQLTVEKEMIKINRNSLNNPINDEASKNFDSAYLEELSKEYYEFDIGNKNEFTFGAFKNPNNNNYDQHSNKENELFLKCENNLQNFVNVNSFDVNRYECNVIEEIKRENLYPKDYCFFKNCFNQSQYKNTLLKSKTKRKNESDSYDSDSYEFNNFHDQESKSSNESNIKNKINLKNEGKKKKFIPEEKEYLDMGLDSKNLFYYNFSITPNDFYAALKANCGLIESKENNVFRNNINDPKKNNMEKFLEDFLNDPKNNDFLWKNNNIIISLEDLNLIDKLSDLDFNNAHINFINEKGEVNGVKKEYEDVIIDEVILSKFLEEKINQALYKD